VAFTVMVPSGLSDPCPKPPARERTARLGVPSLREDFELRYGPLWSGASSLSIGGVTHELEDVMQRLGFGFEGSRSSTPSGRSRPLRHPLLRRRVRQIVCSSSMRTSPPCGAPGPHRRVDGDEYFKTEWQVNCPMDFEEEKP